MQQAVDADEAFQPGTVVPDAQEAVRGFASAAVARAAWACWVRDPQPIDVLFAEVADQVPALPGSGARWGGAGVLKAVRSEWYGFDGEDGACLLFTFDASTVVEIERRRLALLRPLLRPYECRLSERGEVPPAIVRSIRASRVVPVWELPGLAHLAPAASTTDGFPTLAA